MRFPILVMTIHDAVAFAQRSHATPGNRSSQALECWRHAHLIVHSAGIRDQLIANSGISLAKIDIIPHGELGSLYKLLAAPEHSRSERDPYGLLFFGNVRRHRGLSVLLEAFKRINLEIPQSHLVICGHGAARLDQYDQLLEGSANVEVGERVVDEDRVYKRFSSSNIVVLPYTEVSQSGVAAIAFTSGTIVVATCVGSFEEMITNGKTGILVAQQDPDALGLAILRLLQKSSLQDSIRECAMTLGTTTLSWPTIAESTMYTYRVVIVSRAKKEDRSCSVGCGANTKWWRRWESNPRPKLPSTESFHAFPRSFLSRHRR